LLFLVACTQTTVEEPVQLDDSEVHSCAFLTKEQGAEYCGYAKQISGQKTLSCVQTFQGEELPFAKVVIKYIDYDTEEEVREKFDFDFKVDQGLRHNAKDDFYYSGPGVNRKATFLKGLRMVEITETPEGSCEGYNELVDAVYEMA